MPDLHMPLAPWPQGLALARSYGQEYGGGGSGLRGSRRSGSRAETVGEGAAVYRLVPGVEHPLKNGEEHLLRNHSVGPESREGPGRKGAAGCCRRDAPLHTRRGGGSNAPSKDSNRRPGHDPHMLLVSGSASLTPLPHLRRPAAMPPKKRKSGKSGKSGLRRADTVRDRTDECEKAKVRRREIAEAATALATAKDSLEHEKNELEKENKRLEKEKADWAKDKKSLQEDIARLRSDLAVARGQIDELTARVEAEFRLRMFAEAARDAQRWRREFG